METVSTPPKNIRGGRKYKTKLQSPRHAKERKDLKVCVMYHQLLVNALIKRNLGVIEATPSNLRRSCHGGQLHCPTA